MQLDNVVTFTAKISLASLPIFAKRNDLAAGDFIGSIEPPAVTARLKHSFEFRGTNTIRIAFKNTEVKSSGGLGGWLDALPIVEIPGLPDAVLAVVSDAQIAAFRVVYLDESMRITRGDRGELRIYVK